MCQPLLSVCQPLMSGNPERPTVRALCELPVHSKRSFVSPAPRVRTSHDRESRTIIILCLRHVSTTFDLTFMYRLSDFRITILLLHVSFIRDWSLERPSCRPRQLLVISGPQETRPSDNIVAIRDLTASPVLDKKRQRQEPLVDDRPPCRGPSTSSRPRPAVPTALRLHEPPH